MAGYGYDYGLRGWRQTAGWREPVQLRFAGGDYGREYRGGRYREEFRGGGGYGADYESRYRANPLPNRVTERYNRDYVHPGRADEYRVNRAPYGGDRVGRVGDMRQYHAPYQTLGGTRTWRGEWPADWERHHGRYDWGFPNYRADYGRWF